MADAGQLPGAIHNLYPSHQPIGQLHFGSRAMAATRSILKQLLSADWAAASIWQLCNGSQYLVSKQFLSANWATTYIWQLCNGSRYLAAAKNISKTVPISQSGSWYLVSKWFSSADQAAARCISQQWLPSHISQCIWQLGNDILCRTGAAAVQLTLGPRVVQGGWCRWLDVIRKQISATVEGFLGDLRWFGRS